MPNKKMKVACIDGGLVRELKALHDGIEVFQIAPSEICARWSEADIFLVDDQTAHTVAANCGIGSRPSLVVCVKDGDPLPASFREGVVDDLLLLPIRALDIERVLQTHEVVQALREVEQASFAIPTLVKRLQEDVQLAQKIQRRLIKEKFPAIGGLSIKSKYWCGLKAGGDYFDVFEFPDGENVGVILSDSSSYALSTSFIGALMQFSVQVGKDALDDPSQIVKLLHGKIRDGMKEKDRLSILYGVFNRKTYHFRFVNSGRLFAAHQSASGEIRWACAGETEPLSKATMKLPEASEILLSPGDRLMLASDGWEEAIGEPSHSMLSHFLEVEGDSQELLNSMAFLLRRKMEAEQDEEPKAEDDFPMPPQDCSVLLFEVAKNVLRLAK